MKITRKILENIIKEEIASILQEHGIATDKDMSDYEPKSTGMTIPEMSFGEKVRKALGIQSSGDKRLEQMRAYVASPEGQADEAAHRESEAWWQNQGKSQGQIDFERDQDRRDWAKQDKEKERADRMMKVSAERKAEEEYRRKYNNPDNDYLRNIGKI